MVTPTSTTAPKEADRAKEALAAYAVTITMAVVETTQLLIIHLKKNQKITVFPTLQLPKADIN